MMDKVWVATVTKLFKKDLTVYEHETREFDDEASAIAWCEYWTGISSVYSYHLVRPGKQGSRDLTRFYTRGVPGG